VLYRVQKFKAKHTIYTAEENNFVIAYNEQHSYCGQTDNVHHHEHLCVALMEH
jgi:hypothetical protein